MNGAFDVMLGCLNLGAFIFAIYFYAKGQKKAFEDRDSWNNKYKQPLEPAKKNWYSKLTGIEYKEKFPLSASILVMFTDDYHRWQFYYKVLLCASIVLYNPLFGLWDAGIYFVLWGVTFTITYSKNSSKDKHGN